MREGIDGTVPVVRIVLPLLTLAACSGGQTAPLADASTDAPLDASAPRGIRVATGAGTLEVRTDGTFSLLGNDGLTVLAGARAEVLVDGTPRRVVATSNCTLTDAPNGFPAALGARWNDSVMPDVHLGMTCEPAPDVGLDVILAGNPARTGIVVTLRVRAHGPVTVLRASPVVAAGDGAALYFNGTLADDRVLDDGSLIAGDATVRIARGNAARSPIANELPVPLRGNIVANGNLGIEDGASGRGLAAGFLSMENGFGEVGLAPASAPARADGAEGYALYADTVLLPHGVRVADGVPWVTESFVLDAGAASGIEALERYGSALGRVLHRDGSTAPPHWRHRPERAPGFNAALERHVPSAWQSWTLGFRGGYGHDITSAIVRQNVDAAAQDLVPYGFDDVPMDDGWERALGDWEPRPDTFASGLAGETAYAMAHGAGSGFWVAPFTVDRSSALAAAHPAWLATLDPTLGGLIVSGGRAVLDLGRQDVVDEVTRVATAVNASGIAWSKQDYAYQVFATVPSGGITAVQAFRNGWRAVRGATSNDTLLVAVGGFGPTFGLADAIRTGLDTGGRWDELATDPDSLLASTRSFKTTVRTATRRWYLNEDVILLDADAIPFRSMDDPPTVGDTEERTYAVFLAMLGGVIELGDAIVGMRPFALDTFRRIIPAYGHSARPLDVFARDYNERWVLLASSWSQTPVSGGGPDAWHVAAVTNWGTNRDLGTSPPTALPDATRRYHFTRAELGIGTGAFVAWELWSRRLVPVGADGMDLDVAARESAVVIVRAALPGVQLLGTDRHVTGGVPDVEAALWDAGSSVFTARLRVVAAGAGGHTMTEHVGLHADPSIVGTPTATLDGTTAPDLAVTREGELVTVTFTPAQGALATLRVAFSR